MSALIDSVNTGGLQGSIIVSDHSGPRLAFHVRITTVYNG